LKPRRISVSHLVRLDSVLRGTMLIDQLICSPWGSATAVVRRQQGKKFVLITPTTLYAAYDNICLYIRPSQGCPAYLVRQIPFISDVRLSPPYTAELQPKCNIHMQPRGTGLSCSICNWFNDSPINLSTQCPDTSTNT
jgi:hypothetical protein